MKRFGKHRYTLARGLLCVAPLLCLGHAGWANTVVFATGAQMLSGYAENAQATFDINDTAHTITVHLLNLTVDPSSFNQAIGSVRFTLDGAGAPTPSMGLASGTVFDVNNGGVIKNVGAITTNAWQTTASTQGSGEQIALCAVCTTGGTTGLVIGGTTSGKYATTAFQQWIIGSGASTGSFAGWDTAPAWVINFSNTTDLSAVVITNVIFGFGESANYGWGTITVPEETPEPEMLVLIGTGLALVAIAVATGRFRRS